MFPIVQGDLLEDGWNYTKSTSERFKNGKYEGNKWGGKFLRAPDIFYKILEKGNFLRLGQIAEIRFGIKTGANSFFYLKPIERNPEEIIEISKKDPNALIKLKNGAGWEGEIEAKYLKPLIKSPKEIKGIIIQPKYLNHVVFVCNDPKSKLRKTKALEYINWGEKQKIPDRRTIKSRKIWYSLPQIPKADILFNQFFYEKFQFPWNKNEFLVDHAFYYVIYPQKTKNLVLLLNSVINFLIVEIIGRTNLGEGVLQTYAPEMKSVLILDPSFLDDHHSISEIIEKYDAYPPSAIFDEIGINKTKDIRKQNPNPNNKRRLIDEIIFDAIGLTEEERKEVYWAVCELVKQRLDKAKSLKR